MDALITEAKNGDKEAFVRLIRMNKQSLYKTAWIYLRDEQDIADALQNTILSCYENIQRLREPKYFKTWLMWILIKAIVSIHRDSVLHNVHLLQNHPVLLHGSFGGECPCTHL